MKKFLITYVIFSVVVLVLVYLVTLIQETQKRTQALFIEIADEAVLNLDFDDLVKFQTIGFKKDQVIETSDYHVSIYHTISKLGETYLMEFVVYVVPKSDIIYATELRDPLDQTRMTLTKSSDQQVLFDTNEINDYDGIAISYGIEVIGYYYYTTTLIESMDLELTLYDYQGQVIIDELVSFTYVSYDGLNMPLGFMPGYTLSEVNEMRNITHYLIRPMMINITLFLVIDVLMGTLFYWFLKKKVN